MSDIPCAAVELFKLSDWSVQDNFAGKKQIMYTVTFRFEQKGLHTVTLHDVAEEQSILELALTHEINLHHNCGGVCACSSCHIYVESGAEYLDEVTDKEEDFINRAFNPRRNSRLGCQCVLLRGEGSVAVLLPDQRDFPGEELW